MYFVINVFQYSSRIYNCMILYYNGIPSHTVIAAVVMLPDYFFFCP